MVDRKTTKLLTLVFSPCPNDTFLFHALVHGLVCETGIALAAPLLADVETLNAWALAKRLDVSKISFHALGHVLDDYVLLRAGSALGRGCGPLLVGQKNIERERLAGLRIAIPGRLTTAAMLLRLYEPNCRKLVCMRFDEIMPAIARGEVDAGVIIHEGRFSYQGQGLILHRDLGTWWEELSGGPIPLGGIVARRSLGKELICAIERGIRRSVQYAFAAPGKSREYVRLHAQEMDEQITHEHIGLYVNDFTSDLGPEGERAVKVFLERGRAAGILPGAPWQDPFLNI